MSQSFNGNSSTLWSQTCQSHMVCYLIRLAAFQNQSDLHIPKWQRRTVAPRPSQPPQLCLGELTAQVFGGSIPAVFFVAPAVFGLTKRICRKTHHIVISHDVPLAIASWLLDNRDDLRLLIKPSTHSAWVFARQVWSNLHLCRSN